MEGEGHRIENIHDHKKPQRPTFNEFVSLLAIHWGIQIVGRQSIALYPNALLLSE